MRLMIVAHPDDEAIYGGGNLIAHHDWKIICVTNGDNYMRRNEFYNYANFVGAKSEIWSFPDIQNGKPFSKEHEDEIRYNIGLEVGFGNYEQVVTHGLTGEYGHIQHMKLSEIVHDIVPARYLQTFGLATIPHKALPFDILKKKMDYLDAAYVSQRGVWKAPKFMKDIIYENIF